MKGAGRVSPFDRLDLVAHLLRDRPGVTVAEVAAELGVSVRSVFRDIARLRDRGYPVEGERGRGGGLRLPAQWGLGRVQLSREEALGSLLGLAVAEKLAFPMLASGMRTARRKIAGAFPAHDRRLLAPLRSRILVGSPASMAVRNSYTTPAPSVMRSLQAGFVDERVVTIAYLDEQGRATTRRVEPHVLLINWPAWYLLGHDHLRAASRTFRLDRITRVDVEPARFRPRPGDLARELLESAGLSVGDV